MMTNDTPANQPNFVKTFVVKTLIITGIAVYGFGCYQSMTTLTKANAEYEKYAENCQVFLSRAKSAGTTGIARSELDKGLAWLKQNYPQDSFEYRDLKANEVYLQSQNQNTLLPTSIKDSIDNSSNLIDSRELGKFESAQWGAIIIVLSPLLLLTLLLVLYFLALLLGIDEEVDGIIGVLGIDVLKILGIGQI